MEDSCRIVTFKAKEFMEFISAYYKVDDTEVVLLEGSRAIEWVSFSNGRERTAERPLEFFLNAQCKNSNCTEELVDEVVRILDDVCAVQKHCHANGKHYITLRFPPYFMLTPSGSCQLTIVASVYTDTKDRNLQLKVIK